MTKKVPFLSVPSESGEQVQKRLSELGLIDNLRKMESRKGKYYFPLKSEIVMSSVFPDMDTMDWILGFKKFKLVSQEPKRTEKKGREKKKKGGRRTLAERVKEIFDFIDMQSEPFPKSEFQDIGLNPTTAENWIHLIEYIQSQPRIRATRIGSSTYIEKIENKYLSMLRKQVLDSKISIKEREKMMDDYLSALVTLERIEMGRIKK